MILQHCNTVTWIVFLTTSSACLSIFAPCYTTYMQERSDVLARKVEMQRTTPGSEEVNCFMPIINVAQFRPIEYRRPWHLAKLVIHCQSKKKNNDSKSTTDQLNSYFIDNSLPYPDLLYMPPDVMHDILIWDVSQLSSQFYHL